MYSESNKDVAKIAEYYGLKGEDAVKFVGARVIEISKFYKSYKNYKEKQVVSESQVFIALQEATDNPSVENIENARRLIMALQNDQMNIANIEVAPKELIEKKKDPDFKGKAYAADQSDSAQAVGL